MYKKKTLRRMPAVTRRYARIINDLDSVTRRLKNLTDDISRLEFDSAALLNHQYAENQNKHLRTKGPVHRLGIDKATEILFPQEANDEL